MFYNIANRNCKCLRNGGFIHNNYTDFPIPGTYFLYSICQYMYNKHKIYELKLRFLSAKSKKTIPVNGLYMCAILNFATMGKKNPLKTSWIARELLWWLEGQLSFLPNFTNSTKIIIHHLGFLTIITPILY